MIQANAGALQSAIEFCAARGIGASWRTWPLPNLRAAERIEFQLGRKRTGGPSRMPSA